MSTQDSEHVMVIGPDGQPVAVPASALNALEDRDGDRDGEIVQGHDDDGQDGAGERNLTDLVEQPAKVMRIGRMVQQLLEEVKAAPVDEPGRKRLAQVVHTSIAELKDGLAPELDAELDRLIQPFEGDTPSESELRIAQAQLVGWLEGLFHGIQTAIYAQQMAARGQLEQMRRQLPPGSVPQGGPGQPGQAGPQGAPEEEHGRGGMYL